MNPDRITRIREMEEIYDRARKDMATLREYEESGLWLQDYEADERGELPRDLKRGVLSQDGLDEVFEEWNDLSNNSMTDSILQFNRKFVAAKGYESHVADKFPAKKLAVLSCMDTRLTVLLQEALGLKNGDAKIIRNAGAVIPSPWDSAMQSLIVAVYELGVEEIMVVAHTDCGACDMSFSHFREEMLKRGIPEAELQRKDVNLDQWLEGFHDTEKSVRATVETIAHHPLMPKDVTVRGFIMETVTGELTEVR